MIRVQNLSKRYGSFLAVDNISFHVERGGVVGFLGPNGAGKTTTIRILTCYHPATQGTASIGGFDVFNQSMEVRRRIGYLPESAPLYPEMRSREYLKFRGKLRGLSASDLEKAIGRVTDRCWLGEFIDRPIGQLSKGMRQRVGLADAMLHEPDVLILDEPTIGLDPTQIRETRSLIKELGQRHTVLLSSHILSEVEQICSKAIIIAAGRIVASGSPQELRDQFLSKGRVIAEMRGPQVEVEKGVRSIAGVQKVDISADNGWVKLTVEAAPGRDIREDLFKLTSSNGWSLREIRREGATLEDFFVQVVAQQSIKRSRD
ncbi:MAG: ABC transporter ATP-binding protein [Planctomycetota bacterium]